MKRSSAFKMSLVGVLLAVGAFAADAIKMKDLNKGKADISFVEEAANANLTEVKMSELAMNQSSTASVKDLAQQMITDHTKAFEALKTMATSKGIVLPFEAIGSATTTGSDAPGIESATTSGSGNAGDGVAGSYGPMGTGDRMGSKPVPPSAPAASLPKAAQKKFDELAKLTGQKFDRAFLSNLIDDHKKAISLFERESKSGEDSDFKGWATNTLPTLRHHLEMVQAVEKDLKKTSM